MLLHISCYSISEAAFVTRLREKRRGEGGIADSSMRVIWQEKLISAEFKDKALEMSTAVGAPA